MILIVEYDYIEHCCFSHLNTLVNKKKVNKFCLQVDNLVVGFFSMIHKIQPLITGKPLSKLSKIS